MTSLELCHTHTEIQTPCSFPDLLRIRDHYRDSPQCICIAIHLEQTLIDPSNQLLIPFISQKNTPTTQASRLFHHHNCPTVPRSEARASRLLIAAKEKTSNRTSKNCSLSSCLSFSYSQFSSQNLPDYLLSPFLSVLPNLHHQLLILPPARCRLPPEASPSLHSSPKSLPSIPHQ